MVFDRTAMSTGRSMQDFGLCDIKGIFQHTSRMRGKGFLVVAFLDAEANNSYDVSTTLNDWISQSPKIAAAAVVSGDRDKIEAFGVKSEAKFPVLWDPDAYIAPIWAVNVVPTLFIMNDKGMVLGRVRGTNPGELSAAKELLLDEVRKSDEAAAAKAAADAAAKK
jgi:hypothetical protein